MSKELVERVSLESLVQEYVYQNSHRGWHWENVEGYIVNEGPHDEVYIDIIFDDD